MSRLRFDHRQAPAALRRGLAGAPALAVDGLARVVRQSSDHRLEHVMRSPIRYPLLGAIFSQIPRHFDRDAGAGVDAIIRFVITGRADGRADIWDVVIEDGACRVQRPAQIEAFSPRVTITTGGAEFVRLATGTLDPMKAYFKGQIKLGGDIFFAAKMQSLFRTPQGGAARRVEE